MSPKAKGVAKQGQGNLRTLYSHFAGPCAISFGPCSAWKCMLFTCMPSVFLEARSVVSSCVSPHGCCSSNRHGFTCIASPLKCNAIRVLPHRVEISGRNRNWVGLAGGLLIS